ncbi:hypothetical protein A2970_01220 [Candidatus Roizmanbacteria bacterium RIFCSPLOWO2_01_FULL_44_13]|uniref:O-antigen ligase-related domain-containing protein n=1 Tax=Candidatus Roizmanbacteria bacterium RIFCSPLOWO2_01_FULL_44_13 TaxID=1802069 RepID=A0A1F7J9X3_9BACT|nr:MAG: hypothetical protein A2970_01220 [Candidatus Roizmanbacteria bacterium RIFCSPLOWO2_01_FULL_44_13]
MKKPEKTKKTSKHYSETRVARSFSASWRIRMTEATLFFTLILLLPTQLGRHFFFPFSYLAGVRVDYLSPTLYLIDIVIFLLALFNIKAVFKFFSEKISGFFFGLLTLNIIFAQSWPLALYGSVRIIEFLIIIALGKKMLSYLNEKLLLIGFLSGAFIELMLSILQFVFKRSIQGPFYFIGERLFSLATPGIAKTTFSGIEFLRPYGSFSHPNSMAGFYLLVYFFVLTRKSLDRYLWLKYLLLLVSTCLIFISFSKAAILTFLLLNVLYLFFSGRKNFCRVCVAARIVVMFFVASIFLLAQGDPLTAPKRLELIGNAVEIIKKYPLFGVGLNNYLLEQTSFASKFPLFFNQPVHNIFLLLVGEAGIVLTGFILYFFRKLFPSSIFLLLAVVVTGLFDHYWLTLVQNFLLMGVVFSTALQDRDAPARSRR